MLHVSLVSLSFCFVLLFVIQQSKQKFITTSMHQVHVSVQGQDEVESIVHAHHSQASPATTEDTDRDVSPKIEAGMDITYQQRFSSFNYTYSSRDDLENEQVSRL